MSVKMIKVMRKSDGFINEVPEHVARDSKLLSDYGFILAPSDEIKQYEPKSIESEQVETKKRTKKVDNGI